MSRMEPHPPSGVPMQVTGLVGSQLAGASKGSTASRASMKATTSGNAHSGEVTAEECLDGGGTNLMFWTSGEGLRQRTLSASQTYVLSLAPVVDETRPMRMLMTTNRILLPRCHPARGLRLEPARGVGAPSASR